MHNITIPTYIGMRESAIIAIEDNIAWLHIFNRKLNILAHNARDIVFTATDWPYKLNEELH